MKEQDEERESDQVYKAAEHENAQNDKDGDGVCWCKFLHVSSIKTGRQLLEALCNMDTHILKQIHPLSLVLLYTHTHTLLITQKSTNSQDVSNVKHMFFVI